MYIGRILFFIIIIALNYKAIKDYRKNGFFFDQEVSFGALSQLFAAIFDVFFFVIIMLKYW